MAATLQSEGLHAQQRAITSSDFSPAYVPRPRAWERVPVAPATTHGRQRKIWKRVAAPPLGASSVAYRRTVAELESQGSGSRKRVRNKDYVPVWGDAEWRTDVDCPRDGKLDIAGARAAVHSAGEAASCPDSTAIASRHATFPEERLRWIPRKRHNSRWPIETRASAGHLVIPPRPLDNLEVPGEIELVDMKQQVNEKQMEKRSTRRLSRRLSIFPGDCSPRKLAIPSLSPAKMSASSLSPIKRPSVALLPQKVVESPVRSFKVNATPSQVILESPKPDVPQESPLKSSPAQQVDAVRGAISPSPLSNYFPLIFDQPNPEIPAEPEYETQRRRSLQSARHNDRSSTASSRVLNLESTRVPPSRRHSFGSARKALNDSKDRRRTLNVFSATEEGNEKTTPPSAEAAGEKSPDGIGVASPTYSVVKVDAGTNIDIFGTSQEAERRSPDQVSCSDGALEVPAEATSQHVASHDDSCVPMHTDMVQTLATIVSPIRNSLGVIYDADQEALDQATVSPSPRTPEMDSPEMHIEAHSPAGSEDSVTYSPEQLQDEFIFEHQDPEGLSTIYEESVVIDSEDGPLTVKMEAVHAPPTTDVVTDCMTQSGEQEMEENYNLDDAMHSARMKASAEASALDRHTPVVSTNHVGSSIDVSANPSSPRVVEEFVGRPSDIPQLHKTETADSESTSEESVGTPEDDFCMTASLAVEAKDYDDTASVEQPTCPKTLTFSPHSPQPSVTTPEQPTTPAPLSAQSAHHATSPATASPGSENSGFTPINGRQISPPQADKSPAVEESESDVEGGDQDLESEDAMVVDEEVTEALDDDITLSVVAPNIENDTLNLQAMHDDSETEMLRKFVTRVAADKNAKAAAAAAALAAKSARPKRRSGSMGSTTSSTGSPIAKSETPRKRTPLGEKSANSPSPVKKRKLKELDEPEDGKEDSIEVSEDLVEAPKLKRRRKRVDPVLKTPDGVISEADVASSEPGPRRSTRSRTARVALKPAAPSANSIALSLIPVRLPGIAGMDDAMLESHLAAAKSRSDEKDVAAVTRVNTRKNKGGSVPPKLVLARQAEDPAAWRMKELKSVFDAKESRAAGAKGDSAADGRKSRKAKGVRWAEELVRFQGDEAPSVFKSMASSLLADIMGETADEPDELAPSEPPKALAKEEPVEKLVGTPAKKMPLRRTRSSRLQPPTPVKLAEKTAPQAGQPARSTALPKPSVAAAGVASASAPTTRASTSIATRRSKIAKLGMGVNGTPAPKRRGRIL